MSILADITDFTALGRLSSRDICFYLIKNKWLRVTEVAGTIIFDSPAAEKVRVWVPLEGGNQEDYVLSMGKLIRTLSSYESRSQLDILEDFDAFSTGDVIRVGSEDPFDRHSSSVSFDTGVELIYKAKQMLLAGSSVASIASSNVPRAFFGSKKPIRAQEYVRNVRLGQTERGSYIVKVISPLPPELEDKNLTLPSIPEKKPFERAAVESTFRGIIALKDVLAEVERKGKFHFDPFLERVGDGLNADLCEAIIGKKGNEPLPLSFSVAWSPAFKIDVSNDLTESVRFTTNSYQYIREAAEQFRRIEPEEVCGRW